jgi:hypothetical protein
MLETLPGQHGAAHVPHRRISPGQVCVDDLPAVGARRAVASGSSSTVGSMYVHLCSRDGGLLTLIATCTDQLSSTPLLAGSPAGHWPSWHP